MKTARRRILLLASAALFLVSASRAQNLRRGAVFYRATDQSTYTLQKSLGEGFSSRVWQAVTPDAETYALKFYKDPSVAARNSAVLTDVAAMLTQWPHPNFLKIYEPELVMGGVKKKRFTILRSDLVGAPVEELEKTEFRLVDVRGAEFGRRVGNLHRLMTHMRQVIARLETLGWVHHDFNPRNIFSTPSGVFVAGDYDGMTSVNTAPHYQAWEHSYAPPEYFRFGYAGHANHASDHWTVASSLFKLMTGATPTQDHAAAAYGARFYADPSRVLEALASNLTWDSRVRGEFLARVDLKLQSLGQNIFMTGEVRAQFLELWEYVLSAMQPDVYVRRAYLQSLAPAASDDTDSAPPAVFSGAKPAPDSPADAHPNEALAEQVRKMMEAANRAVEAANHAALCANALAARWNQRRAPGP